MPLHRALYRTRQVYHAFRPRIDPAEVVFARRLLSEPEARLFFAMPLNDQRHALEVAGRLRRANQNDPDLLVAALLHDCGKGEVPVWLRILKVVSPAALDKMARLGSTQTPAYRLANHVELSAEAVQAAGASPAVVRYIEGKPAPDEADLMAQLIAADDAS